MLCKIRALQLQMVKPSAVITHLVDKDTHHHLPFLSLAVTIVIQRNVNLLGVGANRCVILKKQARDSSANTLMSHGW